MVSRATVWRALPSICRLHIVSIAAMGTLTFGWMFTGRYLWALAALSASDWFVVNLLNRVVDLAEDQKNGIVGTDVVARWPRLLLVVGFSVLAASFAWLAWWFPALLPWRFAYHLLGLSYNWRVLPGRRRIKQLYFFKNTASAVGFLITVFAYPLVYTNATFVDGVGWDTVAYVCAFFFLFELSYEAIYDLRDVEGDRAENVRSYAVVHGEHGAVAIVDGLLIGSLAAMVAGYVVGAVPWSMFVMAFAPIAQFFFYKRALSRGISSGDCIFLTWFGAVLLALYHLWVVLELPGVV